MCLPAVQLGLFRGHRNAARTPRTPLPYVYARHNSLSQWGDEERPGGPHGPTIYGC